MNKTIFLTLFLVVGCSKSKETDFQYTTYVKNINNMQKEDENKSVESNSEPYNYRKYHPEYNACPYSGRCTY